MAEIKVGAPQEIPLDVWRKMYDVARFACDAKMVIAPEDYLGGFDEFLYYHLLPQKRVGNTDNHNQEYHHARVAVDEDGNWASADRNVSHGNPKGPQDDSFKTELWRTLKRGSGIIPVDNIFGFQLNRNYFHVREDYVWHGQGEGRSLRLISALGRTSIPFQPWAVYIWRGIYKEGVTPPERVAEEYGFVGGDPVPKHKFGRDVELIRMQAPGYKMYPRVWGRQKG